MMHMQFWWGDDLGDFFIKGFQINTPRSMTVLCLCLFVLSIAVEGLKVHKTRSRAKAAREKQRSLSCSPSENAMLLSTDSNSRFSKQYFIDILYGVKELGIFFFHTLLNYGLMLSVMLFNGYIFVAVVMGAFVGYFLFGHLSMKTNMENLQAIQTKMVCSSRCAESGASCADNSGPCSSDACNNHY